MKTLLTLLVGLSGLALVLGSCDDDARILRSIPVVQFESIEATVKEGDPEQTIVLTFDRPFNYDATIRVSVDPSKVTYFSSTPVQQNGVITLAVNKYDTKAVIKVKPVNNPTANSVRIVNFDLSIRHNEFVLGEKRTHTLIIEDDDPSLK